MLRDNTTHPLFHTDFTGHRDTTTSQDEAALARVGTFVMATSWLPCSFGQDTRVLPQRKVVDGPSHHWQTLDVGEHTSLTRMVTTTTFFPRPLVNTALVMQSRWKRWIKVVLVCHTLEVLHARKPRRSCPSTGGFPWNPHRCNVWWRAIGSASTGSRPVVLPVRTGDALMYSRSHARTWRNSVWQTMANLVKTYHGIIAREHPIHPRRVVMPKGLELFTVRFHGTSPPLFIQAWLQQYCRRPFFYSAYRSLIGRETHYERRRGEPFSGPIIPFGSMIRYHPISAKDQSRLHQFGKNVLLGIFLEHVVCGRASSGGHQGRIEELENLDTSEKHARWLSAKEVLMLKMVKISCSNCLEEIMFSEGWPQFTITLHEATNTTVFLQGESDESHSSDTLTDDGEARNDFPSIEGNHVYRHHVEPRLEPLVPKEESFPPLVWMKELPKDVVRGERLTHVQEPSRPDYLWVGMSKSVQLTEKQHWTIEKPKLNNARKLSAFISSIPMTCGSRTQWKTSLWSGREPTSFLDHVFLGCAQRECEPDKGFGQRTQKHVRIANFYRSIWKVTWVGENGANVNALNGTANWQQRQSSNCARSPHHVLTTISSKKGRIGNIWRVVKSLLPNRLAIPVVDWTSCCL